MEGDLELENMARLRGRLRGEADRLEESRRRVGLRGGDSGGVKGMRRGGRIGLKLLRACLHVMHIADGEIILSFARSACHGRFLRSFEGTKEQARIVLEGTYIFVGGRKGQFDGHSVYLFSIPLLSSTPPQLHLELSPSPPAFLR